MGCLILNDTKIRCKIKFWGVTMPLSNHGQRLEPLCSEAFRCNVTSLHVTMDRPPGMVGNVW